MQTVMLRSGQVTTLMGSEDERVEGSLPSYTGVIANATGDAHYKDSPWSAFQAVIQGTGAVSATVTIEGSNDGTFWNGTVLGTITLTGTTSDADGFAIVAPYKYVRAVLASLTGTAASVYVTMGV